MKDTKQQIIEILRGVMSASENRDWGRETHATKRELEIMRNNNDNDFLQIATQILSLFPDREEMVKRLERRKKKIYQVEERDDEGRIEMGENEVFNKAIDLAIKIIRGEI